MKLVKIKSEESKDSNNVNGSETPFPIPQIVNSNKEELSNDVEMI